jgi:dTDP-4-amino-4,6-dideoxygalactose transaminase
MPVHYAGLAADMPALLDIARRHGLKVVEDAAHALPTTCGGQLVGTLGSDATVFSFYANKTITTGEGGMLVTRDAALAKRVRVMRLHGMNRDAFDRYTAKVPSWYYEVVAPGFKYNLTDIAAALGLQQLKKAQMPSSSTRQRIAAMPTTAFADLPLILPPQPRPGDQHAWHLYVAAPGRRRCHGARPPHRAAVRRRHRLQRALHPAAPAPLLARALCADDPSSSRRRRRPMSAS